MNIIEGGNSNTTSVIMPIKKVLKIDSSMSALRLMFKSVMVSSLPLGSASSCALTAQDLLLRDLPFMMHVDNASLVDI